MLSKVAHTGGMSRLMISYDDQTLGVQRFYLDGKGDTQDLHLIIKDTQDNLIEDVNAKGVEKDAKQGLNMKEDSSWGKPTIAPDFKYFFETNWVRSDG